MFVQGIFQDIPSWCHFAEENYDKADLGTVVGFDYALASGKLE